MSSLEERAKGILAGMIAGRGRELHAGGQGDLATWALLKAIIFDHASPNRARALFPELRSELFNSRQPPRNGCRIWMSAYGGDLPSLTALTAIATATAGQTYDGVRNVCVRTFSMGPVVVQVFVTSNPTLADFDVNWNSVGPQPPRVIQIWPSGQSVSWLASPAFNDEGIIWFANHIVATMIQNSETYRG